MRNLAQEARQAANSPRNGLMPVKRQLLRRNATNFERLALAKAKRHARQNRRPEHLTKQ